MPDFEPSSHSASFCPQAPALEMDDVFPSKNKIKNKNTSQSAHQHAVQETVAFAASSWVSFLWHVMMDMIRTGDFCEALNTDLGSVMHGRAPL